MILSVVLVVLLPLCTVGLVTQAAAGRDAALTLTLENDVFTGSDNNYTNGFGMTWVSDDLDTYGDRGFLPAWGRFWAFLPFVSDEGHTTYASWTIAQEMHTPDNIEDPNPPEDDQPYAGVLYLDNLLYARNKRWAHAWELKLGIVGPASQAEHVQKAIHDLVGDAEPQGWDTQLPNEPVINLGYTVGRLAALGQLGGAAGWRIVPLATVGLGTYFTGAGLGLYGEVGWHLVDAIGGTALRTVLNAASTVGVGPVQGWSVAFFGGLGGYGIVHYLPLDGTVFRDSRSVDSEPFVGVSSFGTSVRHGRFVLGLAASFYTDTFETEQKNAEYGVLGLSWYF